MAAPPSRTGSLEFLRRIALFAGVVVIGGALNRFFRMKLAANANGWTGSTVSLWTDAGLSLATIAFSALLIQKRIRWGRWLLVGTLAVLAFSGLETARKGGATSAFTVIETLRAVALIVAAIAIGKSRDLTNWLNDDPPVRIHSVGSETPQSRLLRFREERSRPFAIAEILAWIWVLVWSQFVVSHLTSPGELGSSMLSLLNGPIALGLAVAAWISSILAAAVYSFGYGRFRPACVIAPALSLMVLLTNYFVGVGGIVINLILLGIAIVYRRRLRESLS